LLATCVAALSAAAFATGCGGGQRQDANEPSGTFKVDVVTASFSPKQRLADSAVMRIVVRNADAKTIPNVAVTVTNDDDAKGGAGFTTRSAAAGLSDPTRQLWIVDKGPHGGDTAYVSTWALGPLAAGKTKIFEWHVTPVVAGTHTLRWHVAAGLNGKAIARTADGQDAIGTFKVSVSSKPAAVTVDPKTGNVVTASGASS
jgi:ABC-type glycerol-3-phosphate transport system substrate-binding protein